jgi:signal transduction histidine kinase
MPDRRPPSRLDLVLAGVLTMVGVVTFLLAPASAELGVRRDPDPLGLLLVLAMTVPVAARRTAPLVVVVVTSAALTAGLLYGSYTAVAQFGPLGAICSAAFYLPLRHTLVMAAAVSVVVDGAAAVLFRSQPSVILVTIVTNTIIVAILVAIGALIRRDKETARRLREAELRERETALRAEMAQDRVRIAREVHDIVGHALAGITVQARAGRRQARRDPDATEETLDTIDALASRALVETRQAIGLIRTDADADELRPQPGLADLPALVTELARADVAVELRRCDDLAGLPASVQASAYRIVQESLANVVKHAAPARAVVTVGLDGDVLVLDVRDDGRGRIVAGRHNGVAHHNDAVHDGSGVRGMRQRAVQLGGALDAGPAPDGGWRVQARLPLPGRA